MDLTSAEGRPGLCNCNDFHANALRFLVRPADVDQVLIVGASTRAAGQSVLRAGLRPRAIDLFADLDLAAIAPVRRIDPACYPDALADLADHEPQTPWMYTGALENHPNLVDRITRRRPLWGNPGKVLLAVRDPMAMADALRRAGLPCPDVRDRPDALPHDGTWLVKPRASASGRAIRPLEANQDRRRFEPCYYQERIEGLPLAALFVADRDGATLLGVTRQILGENGFAYRGSLAPWPLEADPRKRIEALGRAIASAFPLVGLFGIDFVLRNGHPWPVEVNPRYTASVEVLEQALGRSLLTEHVRACAPKVAARLSPSRPSRPGPTRFVGK
ncbi:MAG: ATP-grasp domain-containing protein, partial [Isosphaeraceae bacterium]